jgi:hypothetical protein
MEKKTRALAPRTPIALTLTAALYLGLAAAAPLAADDTDDGLEMPQGWVPAALMMPADAEVLTDREIGSSLRMFSFNTAADVDELLAAWEEALRLAGFTITQQLDESLERVIEFSGEGITNAKIAVTPSMLDDLHVIEFDATLQ